MSTTNWVEAEISEADTLKPQQLKPKDQIPPEECDTMCGFWIFICIYLYIYSQFQAYKSWLLAFSISVDVCGELLHIIDLTGINQGTSVDQKVSYDMILKFSNKSTSNGSDKAS